MNVLKWTDDLLKNPARAWADIASGRGLPARLAAAVAVTTLCSGAFGMAAGSYVGVRQALITGYKMPLLLLSTLAICVPVMYIVNAVTVRRLSVLQVVSIGVTSITITAVVLGAFAPVMLLFCYSLTFRYYPHYAFLVLLCTAMVGVGGIISVWYIWRAFRALGYSAGRALFIIACWLIIYQFTGAQMTFVMRPFIGSSKDTVRFEGNFYEAVPMLIENTVKHISGGKNGRTGRKTGRDERNRRRGKSGRDRTYERQNKRAEKNIPYQEKRKHR